MGLINSFNYNFTTNVNQRPASSVRLIEVTKVNSFSKNFKTTVTDKSNVQKKNNIPAVIKKKNA